ncbi:MAG: dihydroorotate dehydrogenase [Bacteroidales bacterium]|nr:dihydroorotate dehydrogenase [Bacteroidales bacterium]
MVNLNTDIAGLHFENPVIPASGTFGFGEDFAPLWDLNRVGGIAVKGTTLEPRYGNPLPRIAECEGGMLNCVGLQNPGIEKVLSEKLPALRSVYKGVILLNISGFSEQEYLSCCEMASQSPDVDAIELNVSCPNVHGGGMAFGTDAKALGLLVAKLRPVCTKPLFVKLSPNVTDIVAVAKAAEEGGADGLVLINTLLGMRININTRKPILSNTTGGLSGDCIFPIALRMVYQVSNACSVPVIGCGGVSSGEQAVEMMMAGARAVQVGSASLRDPWACPRIAQEIADVCIKLKINSISDIWQKTL